MITLFSYNNKQPNFKANLASPRLKYSAEDFFIKINGYGKNEAWAEEIIKTTDSAVNMIRKNRTFENILKVIANGVADANKFTDDISKRMKTGLLRTFRPDWICKESDAYTYYRDNRYSCYKDRLNEVAKKPLKRISANLGMSYPNTRDIVHGDHFFINNSLNHVTSLFNKTIPKYINGELKPENIEEVNDTVAEMRWVLAHATPWVRGSDAISNVLMRAIYKAVGVKTYPPKEGISFDLEAYCTELEDYKKNFASYFEKAPEVIED